MPKLSKRAKAEWDFYMDPVTGRRKFNKLCRNCEHDCKQSYRAIVILCPHYQSKRRSATEREKTWQG